MANTSVVLDGKNRTERRRRQVTRLREQGYIPGVVYGHKEEPACIAVPTEALDRIIRSGERIVELKTESGAQTVVIKDLQWDFLGKEMLHVDFKRVSKDEIIQVTVPIHLHGTAPGSVSGGGVLETPLSSLTVHCRPGDAPTMIEVNINELQMGESILVKDLTMPEGVQTEHDPDAVVVQVGAPMVEEEEMEGEEGESAEPEVIGRPADEEGEGEES